MAGPVRRGMVRPGGARCGWHGNNNERKGNDMNEIQRWEVGFSQMNEHSQGEFITWNDHVAALKAARNELPDVGSWSPEPKFKVGDRVVTRLETYPWVIATADYVVEDGDWYYRSDHYRAEHEALLDLYVPPTPAELIPTLKEHEWVRVTTTYNEKAFEGTVFFAHGAIMVGLNILAPNDSPPNPSITSIERCAAPEVK